MEPTIPSFGVGWLVCLFVGWLGKETCDNRWVDMTSI